MQEPIFQYLQGPEGVLQSRISGLQTATVVGRERRLPPFIDLSGIDTVADNGRGNASQLGGRQIVRKWNPLWCGSARSTAVEARNA
ncbi:msr1437 [Mesorhizobium japonicum MAFF 303099]|uniref:Msr1437 protein n=1 Tax=Mesorhizobium japonicum (strain LMG 29417 / CECT 9101 / MAFF 303099) TaxID=266835 RepID=Q98KK2_RHILO|nr:msr1437 [Mesorhizobium japonicum MAFF 303099]